MSAIDILKLNILKLRIEDKKEKLKLAGKFSFYHTHLFEKMAQKTDSYIKLQELCDMINSWEDICNIPYEFGIALDKLINDPDYVVTIRRAKLNLNMETNGIVLSDELNDIMNNGIKNNGHSTAIGGVAILRGIPSLGLAVSPMGSFASYINLITRYGDNDAVILSAFSKAKYDENNNLVSGLVDEELNMVSDDASEKIYDTTDIIPRIKPEYIIGVIQKKTNGLDEFYSREEIINSVQIKKQ